MSNSLRADTSVYTPIFSSHQGLTGRLLGAILPAACTVSMLVAAGVAQAGFSQSDVTSPGGFVSAYNGVNQGENPDPGYDLSNGLNDFNLNETSFSGASSTSASGSYLNGTHQNNGTGTAGMGYMKASAWSSTQYDGTSFHSNAWVHGGWTDTITILNPALTGQTVTWLFDVDVSGFFQVDGFAPSSGIEVKPYVDNNPLDVGITGFDNGNSDPIAISDQMAQWYRTTDFIDVATTRTVNDTVTFAADIVVGTPFDLGIYSIAIARGRNSSAYPDSVSTADTDAMNSITWGGSGGLLVNSTLVTDFDITSASGVDWSAPVSAIPVPGALLLMLSGLATLFVRGNRIRS